MELHSSSPTSSPRNAGLNAPVSPLRITADLDSPSSLSSKRSWYKSYFPMEPYHDPEPDATNHINLEDHTDGDYEHNSSLWAKAVDIDGYTIVGSSFIGGSYVVWNCIVETLEGGPMGIKKRYSEFNALRQHLIQTFPNAEVALPPLPRKSIVSRFQPRFLEKRRQGLIYFLNCVLLNPEFAGSPVLKDFLFY